MSSFELDPRPRLRGKLHAWAFPGAVALAVALIWSAPNGVETVAAAVFGACVAIMLGTSALYHRVLWEPKARRVMRRLDSLYPRYGFSSHVGYITPTHSEAVRAFGPSQLHRRSFDAACYEVAASDAA